MKSDQLFSDVCSDISAGKFGESGVQFLQIRAFAEKYGVSLDTASGIYKLLSEESLITLCGKHYYITNGLVSPDTPYGKLLRPSRRDLLGVQLCSIDNPFFASITMHLNRIAEKRGMKLLILNSLGDDRIERRNLTLFRELGVRGIFLCSPSEKLIPYYRRFPLPIVSLGKKPGALRCDTVLVDNAHAGAQVAKHLIDMGCADFAYIGLRHNCYSDPRFNGYRQELENCGKALTYRITVNSEVSDELHGCLYSMLSKSAKPLGIFCYHDLLAVETERIIKTCAYKHTAIPQDVCIVGFDDLPVTKTIVPQLSSVSYRYDSISEYAMKCMLSLCGGMSDAAAAPTELIVPSALIIRQSSARI